MNDLITSPLSSKYEGRILVIIKDKSGLVDWIDAAEFAQLAGITPERYSAWLQSMYKIGAVTVSENKTH